jgi:hypothetical protein
MRLIKIIALVGAIVFQPAFAQTMNSLNIDPGEKLLNQSIRVSIDFTSEKKPACGLRVNWGDGRSQTLRVGHDGEEGAPTSPINLNIIYGSPGKYNIEIKGEYLRRGLGSVGACDVKANAVTVAVVDSETDQKYIEKSWAEYLAKLSPMQLQCTRVGATFLGIKFQAISSDEKLVGMNAINPKQLIDRCNEFEKESHPKTNVPCKISGDMGRQDSMCDLVYVQKTENGKLKAISIEETIKLQVQGQPWLLGQRETSAGKSERLFRETEIKIRQVEDQRLFDDLAKQQAAEKERKQLERDRQRVLDEQKTYGQKLNLPPPLDLAKDQTELKAACVSATWEYSSRVANSLGPSQWASCVSLKMHGDPKFIPYMNAWRATFRNGTFDIWSLGAYHDRCARDFIVMVDSSGRCM